MQPSRKAALPALHPERDLHRGAERMSTAVRRAKAATCHSKLCQLLQESHRKACAPNQCAPIIFHRQEDKHSRVLTLLAGHWMGRRLVIVYKTSGPQPS